MNRNSLTTWEATAFAYGFGFGLWYGVFAATCYLTEAL